MEMDKLKEIRERIISEELYAVGRKVHSRKDHRLIAEIPLYVGDNITWLENIAKFIAHAPTDIRCLLALVNKQQAEIERLKSDIFDPEARLMDMPKRTRKCKIVFEEED
jgi:hypothetical protein